MKKLLLFTFSILILVGANKYFTTSTSEDKTRTKFTKEQRIQGAVDEEFRRTKDPALGYPPTERLALALEVTQRLQTQQLLLQRGDITNAKWRERGPSNRGGRTRTLLIDQNDTTGNTLWAGGVSGGLWKTTDISAGAPIWENVDDFLENLAISAIAQDPNQPNIMFLGTGEGFGNIDGVRGIGLFRSMDGGDNWSLLPSTTNSAFRRTRSIVIHPETGDIYSASTGGLWRSQNNGDNWSKVLGSNSSGFYDIVHASNGILYVSSSGSVYRSSTGDSGDWDSLFGGGSGFPTGLSRIELAISESSPNIMYILGATGSTASPVYTSNDGGDTWHPRDTPKNNNGNEFTNGQAWYDLEIAVDPFDPLHIVVGGVITMTSNDGGFSFSRFGQNIHSDHHKIIFDKNRNNTIYFGNDGGVYRSITGTSPQAENKNTGYNVTQFYACAIHPEEFSNYFLGGTQDNNSLQLNAVGITTGKSVRGGDGVYCHIDQNEPAIQIVSSQNGNYGLSMNGGQSFSGGVSVNGSFLSPSDYDNNANIMYAQTFDGDYYRWYVETGNLEITDIPDFNPNISTIAVDPNTENRIYIGTFSGGIIRVDNAHDEDQVSGVSINPSNSGAVSSITIEDGNPNHLLATKSSYGSVSVYESFNAGANWISVEGNLPDMPVRGGLFSPTNSSQAMIATEAGVWTTDFLDGNNTIWIPPVTGRGIPLVRVDMLQLRRSDNIVLAATHGRGLYTTDVFAAPKAKLLIDQVGYLDTELNFSGELSYSVDEYLWDFGDGTSSTDEVVTHSYSTIGEYPISLTINQSLTDNGALKILPDMGTPYSPEGEQYGGDFEGETQQYGVETISGSSFERGNSTMPGKDGTHSGENAFVVGLNEEYYQPGTRTNLYLPNFNMEDVGIYEFSFWTQYRLSSGKDGFRVEYSTNKGSSWSQLGSVDDPDWYNTKNSNLESASFPIGASYFSGQKLAYVPYKLNISHLAGNANVAFRFVFKGNAFGSYRGIAIDDVSITKYEGDLETKVFDFSGSYTDPNEITINWNTQPEYKCVRFELERSINGQVFEKVADIPAEGLTTASLSDYSQEVLAQRDLYFFKLKVYNEDATIDYSYAFETPVIVIRKNDSETKAFAPFPNPFYDKINLTFNADVQETVVYEVFSASGQLVLKGHLEQPGIFGSIDVGGGLPAGAYFLKVKIGAEEAQVFKLISGVN